MDNRYLYEQFEAKKTAGMEAYRDKRFSEARKQLLEAAEFLYKLANKSEGKLRGTRVENAERLVEMARKIKDMPDGDGGDGRVAKETLSHGEGDQNGWMLADRPGTRFDDIAGLQDVKDAIQTKMILPIQHPEKAERFGVRLGGGMLLYGPPGTGKTMLARAIAGEVDAPFFTVSPADILHHHVGASEKNIKELFHSARQHDLAIIFMDEVEALIPRRDLKDQTPVMKRLVPQLLAELEGVGNEQNNPLLFVGATNKPWELDEAVLRPGRFDEKVYVPLPDAEARRQILYSQLQERPLDPEVSFDDLVTRTEGYSGADVVGLCSRVLSDVFRKSIHNDDMIFVETADFDTVLETWKPSVQPSMLTRYDRFAAGGE